MLEKDIENLIAKYPDDFFPNEGFVLVGQQLSYQGRRFDLLFNDKHNRKILIEVKKGILTREASGQIAEYYGLLKMNDVTLNIELILVANIIPNERRFFLESVGISCKEISEMWIRNISEKYSIPLNEEHVSDNKSIKTGENAKNFEITKKLSIKTMDDLYNHIKIPDGKFMIDYIIKSFSDSGEYECKIEQNKIFYSYSMHKIIGPKLRYDYAFIVNQKDLLFYIRKPAEKWLKEIGKIENVENNLNIRRTNSINEMTVRVDNMNIAKKLCDILLLNTKNF